MLEFLLDKEFDFVIAYDNRPGSYYELCHPQQHSDKSNDHMIFTLVNRRIYYSFNWQQRKLISFEELTEKINDHKHIFNKELIEELRKEIKSRGIHKNPIEHATEKQLKLIEKIECLSNKFKGETKREAQKWIAENIDKCSWFKKEFNNFAEKCSNADRDPYYDDSDDADEMYDFEDRPENY
jgi:hypothetical protein